MKMKKALSLILAVLMVVTAVPLSGMAVEACEHDYDYYPGRTGKHTYYCVLCEDEGIESCTGGTATCSSGKICEKCKVVYTNAAEHSYTNEVIADKYIATNGDCKTVKTYYTSCVTCGESSKGKTEEATFPGTSRGEHSFTNYVADGNATCSNPGTKTAKCDVCGVAKDTVNGTASDLIAHKYIEVVATKYEKTKATCTVQGEYYKSCEYCEARGTATFKTDKLPHNFTEVANPEDNALVKSPATCKEDAVYFMNCSVCHTSAKHIAGSGDKTFVDKGSKEKHIAKYDTKVKKPAAADESKYLILKADCLNDAMYSMLCEECGIAKATKLSEAKREGTDYYNKADTALNLLHNKFDKADLMTKISEGKAATCTSAAEPAVYKCNFASCRDEEFYKYPDNAKFDAAGKSIPLDHKFDEKRSKAYKDADCEDNGEYGEEYCTVCKTTVYIDKDGTQRDAAYTLLNPIKNLGGHKDANNDQWCDVCDEPVTAKDVCTCICHKKDGIMYFVALILKWFWKLSGSNPYCPAPCGEAHY